MRDNDLTIDKYLRSTWLNIKKMYNDRAMEHGSSMVNGFTLLSIDPKMGTPSTSLGPKMGVAPTSISRTLKNLEEKGLIERKANPEDGRSVLIVLTDKGHEMRDVSKEIVLNFYEAVEEKISKKDMDKFLSVLNQINSIAIDKKIFENKEHIN